MVYDLFVDCFALWIFFLFLVEQARDYLILCLSLEKIFDFLYMEQKCVGGQMHVISNGFPCK